MGERQRGGFKNSLPQGDEEGTSGRGRDYGDVGEGELLLRIFEKNVMRKGGISAQEERRRAAF